MAKRKGSKPQYSKPASQKPKFTPEEKQAEEKRKSNVAKHSTFITIFIVVILVLSFAGRWIYAIQKNYFGTFVKVDYSVEEALENIDGLIPTETESEEVLPYQNALDLYTASHLCDEVEMTSSDGIKLHAHLYDNDSKKTVIILQSFGIEGNSDFLPLADLYKEYDCNFLMIDARATGESEGEYYSYGYLEQHDLSDWIAWCNDRLGNQSYLIWGIAAGANTALFADENANLPDCDCIEAIVAENPYASLHELAKKNIQKWYTLPAFPFLNAIELRVNLSDIGFSVKNLNLETVLNNTPEDIPVLFLTSDRDAYVQEEFTQVVYSFFQGEKEILVGSGSHGTVYAEKQDDILKWIKNNWK
jgi:uncharacterized protein